VSGRVSTKFFSMKTSSFARRKYLEEGQPACFFRPVFGLKSMWRCSLSRVTVVFYNGVYCWLVVGFHLENPARMLSAIVSEGIENGPKSSKMRKTFVSREAYPTERKG